MNIESIFYAVTIKTFPFTETKEIGCYSAENTAIEVSNFVRNAFQCHVSCGIDVFCREYKGTIIRTNAGLRLKDTPMGCLTMIIEAFTQREAFEKTGDL